MSEAASQSVCSDSPLCFTHAEDDVIRCAHLLTKTEAGGSHPDLGATATRLASWRFYCLLLACVRFLEVQS